ncbi:MAG: M15 family metallopeptidase, partial [bacterium]|nr:M15 family metallopeptidase [bacterium]
MELTSIYKQYYGDPGLPNTPESKKYQEENIIEIETVGWDMDFKGIYTLRVHKKLADVFRSLFKHIQFYNQNCNKKDQYILYGQKGFSYAYSHRRTKNGDISPHSYGIAIDINPAENCDFEIHKLKAGNRFYKKKQFWKIPPWMVEIFERHDFNWGGKWWGKKKYIDPMHFEYGYPEPQPIPLLNNTVFPLAEDKSAVESPLKYFFLNESGRNGFYPLGLNHRSFHGGIHLPSKNPDVPQAIRCSFKGDVVAARFIKVSETSRTSIICHTGNHVGFVLIRHRVRLAKDGDKTDQRFDGQPVKNLYSLYMHLMPVDFSSLEKEDNPYHHVTWLQQLYQRQHGTAARVNPLRQIAGNIGLVDQFAGNASNYKCYKDGEWATESIEVKDPARIHFLHKPLSREIGDVINALEEGKMVTFAQPFLTVEAGDVIGATKSPDRGCQSLNTFITRIKKIDPKFQSGFLHLELFTLPDEPLFKELFEKSGIPGSSISELTGKEDNMIDDHEIQSIIDALTVNIDNEADDAKKETAETLRSLMESSENKIDAYSKALIDFFKEPQDFAKESETDLLSQEIESESYPIHLELDNEEFPVKGGEYDVKAEFTIEENGSEKTVTHWFKLKPEPGKKSNVVMQVPVPAKSVSLSCKDLHFQSEVKLKSSIMEEAVSYRWRNAILDQGNDWNLATVEQQVKTKENTYQAKKPLAKVFEAMTWWDDKYAAPLGDALFGPDKEKGQLPKESNIKNIHPITGIWMLGLLNLQKKLQFLTPSFDKTEEKQAELRYLGWGAVMDDNQTIQWSARENRMSDVTYGSGSYLAAVFHDHRRHTIKLEAKPASGDPVTLFNGNSAEGYLVKEIPFTFWGEWELTSDIDASKLDKDLTLNTTLKGIKPVLADPLASPQVRSGANDYHFKIQFNSGCPENLQAFLLLKYEIIKKEQEIDSLADTITIDDYPVDSGQGDSAPSPQQQTATERPPDIKTLGAAIPVKSNTWVADKPGYILSKKGFYIGKTDPNEKSLELSDKFSFDELQKAYQAVKINRLIICDVIGLEKFCCKKVSFKPVAWEENDQKLVIEATKNGTAAKDIKHTLEDVENFLKIPKQGMMFSIKIDGRDNRVNDEKRKRPPVIEDETDNDFKNLILKELSVYLTHAKAKTYSANIIAVFNKSNPGETFTIRSTILHILGFLRGKIGRGLKLISLSKDGKALTFTYYYSKTLPETSSKAQELD